MQNFKLAGLLLVSALSTSAHADKESSVLIEKGGCRLQAHSFLLPARGRADLPRYAFRIEAAPDGSKQWDFTFDDEPLYHMTNIEGTMEKVPKGAREVTYKATLHQFETYEEIITFKNLNLGPVPAPLTGTDESGRLRTFDVVSRFLKLEKPVTATTPSGISMTLPAQAPRGLMDLFNVFNGNADALFFQVETAPNQALVTLPNSPLFKKYGKPVRIQLDTPKPNSMIYYQADNTYKRLAVDFPGRKTATHLDELTLIVRQRVELQAIPVTVKLPFPQKP